MFVLVITASGCKKNEAKVYQEENPYPEFLIQSKFNQYSKNVLLTYKGEAGFVFRPINKGNVTSLVMKLPNAISNLRVTLWDDSTKTVLHTEMINITAPNSETTFPITPFLLEKNKRYLISFKSNTSVERAVSSSYSINGFPKTIGNITFLKTRYNVDASDTYPSREMTVATIGDVSFNFQRTE